MGFYKNKRVGDPKWIAGDEEHDAALAENGVSVDALSRTSGRPIRWLVENIIPHEAVTLIAGDPGAGKTFFACQLAADAARVSQLRVVLATSGCESPELLRWRLDQAEGDARRVALATLTPNGFYDRRGNPTDEEIDERMAILYHTLEATGDPTSGILPAEINVPDDSCPTPRAASLLVIDDIDGWFGKPGNLLPAAALTRAIQRLNELARSLRVAIVVLARTQLSVEGRMTSRQLSRLSHAANVVWMVVRDREKADGRRQKAEQEMENPKSEIENQKSGEPPAYSQSVRRWFLPVKNNFSPDAATYGRAFEIFDGQIRWHGDDPAPSLAEATLPSSHNSDRRRLRRAAAAWLQEALAAGPVPSEELFQQGLKCGHSRGTLQRAATELGIHSHKTGFNGGWEMRWVPQPEVRGTGSKARLAGSGFRILGGEDAQRGRHGEAESGGEEIANCELPRDVPPATRANCKLQGGDRCSSKSGEASCAPSLKCGESDDSSCAPSAEREESCDASCASSRPSEVTPPRPNPFTESPKGERTDAETEHDDDGAAQRPSEKLPTWHEVAIEALREAC
jgi:hypothetical protein